MTHKGYFIIGILTTLVALFFTIDAATSLTEGTKQVGEGLGALGFSIISSMGFFLSSKR